MVFAKAPRTTRFRFPIRPAAIAAVCLSVSFSLSLASADPEKDLRALREGDAPTRLHAAKSLAALDRPMPEAVAALLEATVDPEAGIHDAALATLVEIADRYEENVPALLKGLDHENVGVQWQTARALERLRSRDAIVAPELLKLVASSETKTATRSNAARALGAMRPPTREHFDALLAAVDSGDETVAAGAVEGLGKMGPYGSDAAARVLAWVEELPDDPVRQHVGVKTLGQIVPRGELPETFARVVPLLAERMESEEVQLRILGVEALGRVGGPALDHLDRIEAIAADEAEDPRLRKSAADAARRLKGSTGEAAELLERVRSGTFVPGRRERPAAPSRGPAGKGSGRGARP